MTMGKRSLCIETSLCIAVGVAAIFACSGQDGSLQPADFESEVLPSGEPLGPDAREAEFRRQHAATLSPEERIEIENRLRENGVDVAEVAFSGRMLTVGDTYLEADALLSRQPGEEGLVEKGKTFSPTDGRTSIGGLPLAPDLFSQIFNGKYQFHRPDISNVTVVVPNGASAAFLVTAFQQATNAIWGAASDCLSTVSVKTRAQYDALSQDDKILTKPIFVNFGSNACPGLDSEERACSLFPRLETREFEINVLQTRLVPGTRIGVVSTHISSVTPRNVGSLMHELLHTLGMAHSTETKSVRVRATSDSPFVFSVMQTGSCTPDTAGCSITNTLSLDDIATIDTLYSPQPGASCLYVAGLKTLVPN
jgi:hypothetical protein